MIISVLPARKGSKRIKNKNIKLFNGKAILTYPLKQIIKSKLFSRNYISTDSSKILFMGKKLGFDIISKRKKKFSDDKTGIIKVIRHHIEELRKLNIFPEYICCIFPTAVFFKAEHLIKAFKLLKNNKHIDYVFTAHSIDSSFLRSFVVSKNNQIKKMNFPKYYNQRSQDLEKIYIDSGQFYFARTSTFLREKKVFTNKSKIIDLSNYKVIDINYLDDWKKAEKILK